MLDSDTVMFLAISGFVAVLFVLAVRNLVRQSKKSAQSPTETRETYGEPMWEGDCPDCGGTRIGLDYNKRLTNHNKPNGSHCHTRRAVRKRLAR